MLTVPRKQPACLAWRHPLPVGAVGRCIGQTDLPVDRRKAKRLAHRIRHAARRHGWPRVIYTSPLRRCADVGRCLRRWGWRHHIDAALLEMDFGAWDGQPWSAISHNEVDAWCADFTGYAPGGGESLNAVFARVQRWVEQAPSVVPSALDGQVAPRLIVAHAGWMLTRQWQLTHSAPPASAAHWPRPPAYGACWSC
jgi:alpha-ribazole phosphatase